MSWRALFSRANRLAGIGRAVVAAGKAGDAEKRLRAKKYTVELLGGARGLAAKVGQMMAQGENAETLENALHSASPPMPFSEVASLLDSAYGVPHQTHFPRLDQQGIPASLGQVHFGKLPGGRRVAVKVQYPDIREAVEAELRLFGWLPKAGPVSRFGISLEGYQRAFAKNGRQELDYLEESARQVRYRELAQPLAALVVPEVLPEYCRSRVLVQAREDGFSLQKAAALPPGPRQAIGREFLHHFLHMLFRHGFLHADPHPGNWAFRQSGRSKFSIILYDYGCVLEMAPGRRRALLRAILALREREPVDPAACLAMVGFDAEKLRDLGASLPALLGILFEPFAFGQPFDVKQWRLSERMDRVAGDLKWWFRSAAPPDLIFLMRALHGLVLALARLDARLDWGEALDECLGDLFDEARSLELCDVGEGGPLFSGVARTLKVYVEKKSGVKINLTLPARLAEDIAAAMDDTVLDAIRPQNIDLAAIQARARKSGFVPQVLFELADAERQVRVWLD
ncbi:MAG: AarF/ABC1/UbiB kinase family protein [Nitrospinaceae bacterium]|nr:MAG: AarF/ABC1/UbiB kinase family protein [Nitrospinaceae bacterium]